RRLRDERRAVPVLLRIGTGGVESVPRRRGEAAVEVDLAHLVRDRMEAIALGDGRQHGRRPATHALVVAVRDRQEDARGGVARRAEQLTVLAEADAPAVVARAAQDLELRPVRPEAIEALTKAVRLPADGAVEAAVADHAVEPVVEAVREVAR